MRMKYKVGDKVRIISNLTYGERYPYVNSDGDRKTMDTNRKMTELAGNIATISYVNSTRGVYNIEECPDTSWVDTMFEDIPVDGPKVSVGDRVKIKSDLSSCDEYFYVNLDDEDREEEQLDCYDEMEELAGREATVTKVDSDGTFKLDIDSSDNWWCMSMIEDKSIRGELKVGDKVMVVDDLEDRSYYYTDKNSGRRESFSTYSAQRRLSGMPVTISRVDSDGTFKVEEDDGSNWWCLSMFDLSKEVKEVQKGTFSFNANGYLWGTVVAPMSRLEDVKVIPFIKYDNNSIYWIHSEDGTKVSRSRSSNVKDLINKKLQYDKLYDDGDVRVYFKDSYGDSDSTYVPECCLMPWNMKVADLPRPTDEYMAKAYDAYIKKFEPEMLKAPVADSFPAVDLKRDDYVKLRSDIKPDVTYNFKGVAFSVNATTIGRLKDKVFKVDGVVTESKEADTYLTLCSLNTFGEWKVDNSLVVYAECRRILFEKTEAPATSAPIKAVVLTAELVAKINTNMTKRQLVDIYDEPVLSSYTKAQIIELIKQKFEKQNQNKNIMSDESEEIKMSKLGLGGMLTRMFGEVGEITDGSLALTFAGAVAVRRKDGDFVRYDADGENIENQGSFILEGSSKFMMLMPSPTVAVGDIIKHKGKFLQVLDIKDNGNLSTVNFESGTKTSVLKETNLFGMQFYTKVFSMMTAMNTGDGTTPGGFNPLMMLILNKDEEGSESKMDMTTMLMLSGMFGGQGATGQMNPMMMMALLGDKEGTEGSGMKDMVMMSMFMGGNSPFGNMFGQTTPAQIAEPIKPVDNGLAELCKSQATAIEQLNKTVADLTAKLETPAETKTTGKKGAATTDK